MDERRDHLSDMVNERIYKILDARMQIWDRQLMDRFELIDSQITNIQAIIARVEKKCEELDLKMGGMEHKLEKSIARIDKLEEELQILCDWLYKHETRYDDIAKN